ncbi:unnamed protein product [Linum trigynum]|uniref:Reverse transcriptase Ty1/copia-type domain-containing protein n=1 Tax=Linum trigynum TaxID=586398 RepID=A0AAV2GMB3_9ROSI
MSQPPGFRDLDHPIHVCRLSQAIYVLRQAPRSWYLALSGFLEQERFVKSKYDASLLIYHHGGVTLYFLVYVGDLLLTGNDSSALVQFQARLAARFSLKRLGSVNYFLGIEVLSTTSGFLQSQHKYVLDLLHRFDMHDSQLAPTLLSSTTRICLSDNSPRGKALSSFLLKTGCSGGLAFVLSFSWRGILFSDYAWWMDNTNSHGWTSIFGSSSRGGNSVDSSQGSINQPFPDSRSLSVDQMEFNLGSDFGWENSM